MVSILHFRDRFEVRPVEVRGTWDEVQVARQNYERLCGENGSSVAPEAAFDDWEGDDLVLTLADGNEHLAVSGRKMQWDH